MGPIAYLAIIHPSSTCLRRERKNVQPALTQNLASQRSSYTRLTIYIYICVCVDSERFYFVDM